MVNIHLYNANIMCTYSNTSRIIHRQCKHKQNTVCTCTHVVVHKIKCTDRQIANSRYASAQRRFTYPCPTGIKDLGPRVLETDVCGHLKTEARRFYGRVRVCKYSPATEHMLIQCEQGGPEYE